MTKEISLVEACLIYSIKNRVDRKTTYKELGKILNDNKINSSTSTSCSIFPSSFNFKKSGKSNIFDGFCLKKNKKKKRREFL